ncbi:hypothetical protein HYDPIDRAFT_126106 [Hydnomerulius pinastri MD-312]|nr:hypothetical protein HYDPIDRAFT_126106 [Hydnomerulius pinastri MD-312]
MTQVFNVVLIGECGVGKSSIINLLAGRPIAGISLDTEMVTREPHPYTISLGSGQYRLHDTMGFNQPISSEFEHLTPYKQALDLLRSLNEEVSLLLLCMRNDRITSSLARIHWLFNDFFFGGEARIGLVITHLEREPVMDDWWTRNEGSIRKHKIQCLGHACITTVGGGMTPQASRYQESKSAIEALLNNHTSGHPLQLFPGGLPKSALRDLEQHGGLNEAEATTLVGTILKEVEPPNIPNIVLFGEAGVGKSSIINLLAGAEVASISSDIRGCTLDATGYTITTGDNRQIRIYDTVGLNEPKIGPTGFAQAIQKAADLIRSLRQHGGVDLLLFCMRGNRVTETVQSNFRLFHEFLCDAKVPAALIITNLEGEENLEDWWSRNGEALCRDYEIKAVGHACVTTMRNPQGIYRDKVEQSRQSVLTLLETKSGTRHRFVMDEHWLEKFLKRLVMFVVRIGGISYKEKQLMKKLIKRCGLPNEYAKEVVRLVGNPVN